LTKIEKIFRLIMELVKTKFTGSIEIIFNCGGVRGVKKITRENLDI
jgi:hypothetical protein